MHTQRKPQGKFFVPVAGFVVKASLARPWAPPPSADSGEGGGTGASAKKVVENAPAGTKVFINLCGHEGVSPPIDQARRTVRERREILSRKLGNVPCKLHNLSWHVRPGGDRSIFCATFP